jgi:exopolysaccharide production protein ExoZ
MDVSNGAKRIELISIQYLRGIAAMMVVVFHLVVNSNLFEKGPAFQRAYFLNAGVDIFFVISGFIMWHTTRARRVTPLGFMSDRIIRIVPLYWVVTIATMAIAYFLPGLMRSTVFNLPHGIASLFFIPVHHPVFPNEYWPVVVPGWSLNYEMFFYLVFALSLALPTRFQLSFLVVSFAAIFGIARLFNGNGLNVFFGEEMNLEFIFGVLLGEAVARGLKIRKEACVALVLVGFAFMVVSEQIHVARIFRWGIPALAIVAGAVLYERSAKTPHIPALKMIGDASYSLYLIHGLVIAGCRPILARIIPENAGWMGTLFGTAFILAVAISAAYAAQRLIEKPASRFLKGIRRNDKLPAAGATSPAV